VSGGKGGRDTTRVSGRRRRRGREKVTPPTGYEASDVSVKAKAKHAF